ncbi:DNA methyltransferase [Roseibium algicola]|uniref:class I SAM-dependent DNA methyltransferase n=1 Tax=Roseibium algicola TaxID=2857014 RepID=UPI00345A37BD
MAGHQYSGDVDRFIDRWSGSEGGQERANYALFLSELCDVLEVARPEPASAAHENNDYVFERTVKSQSFDESFKRGRIDLYKRGCFILEAKQTRIREVAANTPGQGDLFQIENAASSQTAHGWDVVMTSARKQAEAYARKLPDDHPYPPFILTCDVGRLIEVFADFSETGRHYSPFPDSNAFRIHLEDLRIPAIRQRLAMIWCDPHKLDPAKQSAKVTREIAARLADVSKALEDRGHEASEVAHFLMRCLFTMFVEDVGLIPHDGFTKILDACVENPKRFAPDMEHLWQTMDKGEYSPVIGEQILRFNGKLFKNASALRLEENEISLLRQAAQADWRDLEPAIFGSLFEKALDPAERKRLGAHYTPRPHVERLVNATIFEPLQEDWSDVKTVAAKELRAGSKANAINEILAFLRKLASIRILDPACGTGNFLYVALMQMKQLEGDVLTVLEDLGGENSVKRFREISVMPEQFLGMEINSRAVRIAELVLWIGYLQWHLKTRKGPPPEPVIHDSDHVIEKDAVLTWDGYPERPLKRDATGKPVQKYGADGAIDPVFLLANPRVPVWLDADFIVGNPPFIGGKDLRARLGGDYAEALWKAHPTINNSADFVMYWWDACARLLASKKTRLRRFGLVTTNSITQVFQRRVVDQHLNSKKPVSLVMAIPDHPWTKASKDAAAVRIAMTVAAAGEHEGVLGTVTSETGLETDDPKIGMMMTRGRINADLTVGVDVTTVKGLLSNAALCSPGVKLHGDGFIISDTKAIELGLGRREGLEHHIRDYRNGRDLTSRPRRVKAIDLFGLSKDEVRHRFPEVYQHLLITVRSQREIQFLKSPTKDAASYLEKWLEFGKPRTELRPALEDLPRYIATVETAKHRVFQFLDADILPDNMLVAISSGDAFHLGVLSSSIHRLWTAKQGGALEDRPRYTKSRCFDPFPFPETPDALKRRIRLVAEELDTTRKQVLEEYPDLTLTGLYNVLEKLYLPPSGLNNKDEDVCQRGRGLILKELHEELDELVFQAYGWPKTLSDQEILGRLVELNTARAADERRGFIRWLRPDYQIDKFGPLAHRADKVQTLAVASEKRKKRPFPKKAADQAAEIRNLMLDAEEPVSVMDLASRYSNSRKVADDIQELLKARCALGEAESHDGGQRYTAVRA